MRALNFQERLVRFTAGAVAAILLLDTLSLYRSRPAALLRVFEAFVRSGLLPDATLVLAALVTMAGLFWASRRRAQRGDLWRTWAGAAGIFLGTWLLYLASAYFVSMRWNTPRGNVYFPELAAAFLQGRTYLEEAPSSRDLTFFQGHWFVAFPPLASLLMLPQVARGGVEAVNSIKFSIFFGALNVALVYLILESLHRKGWVRLGARGSLWLAALLGFGTVHWYMSLSGQVWYLSQVLTVTWAALAIYLLLETQALWAASLALSVGMLARPNIVLLWFFLLGIHVELKSINRANALQRLLRPWLFSMLPLGLAMAALLWYNGVRFGDPFDFGYRAMKAGSVLGFDLAAYGQFSLHFLPRNFKIAFLALPRWVSSCRCFAPSEDGMSIFVTTPVLLLLYKARKNTPWVWSAWISSLLLLLPLMLYFNTGSAQFGYRFLMDLILPLLCLLALVPRRGLPTTMRLLILAGVLINYFGVVWFSAHLPMPPDSAAFFSP